MLGIRLNAEQEKQLARHAHERGRPKSALARDWIIERLNRDDVDARVRDAARLHAASETLESRKAAEAASDRFAQWLDSIDGGYDWGPEGPPEPR